MNESDIKRYLAENRSSDDPVVQATCRKLETALKDPRLKDEGVVWVNDGVGDPKKHPGPQPESPALKRGWALHFLTTPAGKEWLQADARGQQWLTSADAKDWLKTPDGKGWQELAAKAPSDLRLRVLGVDKLKLAWTNNNAAQTGVEIEYCIEGQKWAKLGTVSADQTEYVARGLAPCTSYRFRLRGIDAHYSAIGEVGSAATRPLKLFILAIGISSYRDKKFELKFADADAQAFAAAWQAQEGKVFQKVNAKVLTNEQASGEQIAGGLKWLAENAAKSDWSLILLVGRGVVDSQDRYYYCPHDFDAANLTGTGLSSERIGQALDKARGSLLFLDTPQSAAAAKSFEKAEGRFVLATSGVGPTPETVGQGAFTRAFLECLKNPLESDLDGDSLLSVAEIESATEASLKRLTGGKQLLLKSGKLSNPPLQARDK